MDIIKKGEEFEQRKHVFKTTSERIKASREVKDLILSLNEIYKQDKDPAIMDLMKRLTAVKQKIDGEVWGIEPFERFGKLAMNKLDKVFITSVEGSLDLLPDDYFDVIYFNDVLEHLLDPYSVLEKIKIKLKDNGKIISSIPNIRYFRTFFKLLFKGEWDYEIEGYKYHPTIKAPLSN